MNKKLKETLEVELSIAEYALMMNNPTVTRIMQVCSDFCDEHFVTNKTHKELREKCDELQYEIDDLEDILSQIRSLAG